MGLMFILAGVVALTRNNGNVGAPEILGQFAGTIVQALPMILFIAFYDVIANKAISISCTAAFEAMNAVNYVGGGTAAPTGGGGNMVCDNQLSPISVLATGMKLIYAVMNLQVPTPQMDSGGGWSWVLAPIVNAAAGNVLVGLIQWSTAAVVAAVFIYIAIELLGFALEAPFVISLAPMFLGFRFVPTLEHLAEGSKRYLPNFAVRLFFVLLPISLCIGLVTAETAAVNGAVSFSDLLALLGSVIVCAIFVAKIKERVQNAILSGQSTMSGWKDVVMPAAQAAAEVAAVVATGGLALGAGIEAFRALGGGGINAAADATMDLPTAHATSDPYGTDGPLALQPPADHAGDRNASSSNWNTSRQLALTSGGDPGEAGPAPAPPDSPPPPAPYPHGLDMPDTTGTVDSDVASKGPLAPTSEPGATEVQSRPSATHNAATGGQPHIQHHRSDTGESWRIDDPRATRDTAGPGAQRAADDATSRERDASMDRSGASSEPVTASIAPLSPDTNEITTPDPAPQTSVSDDVLAGEDFIDAQFRDLPDPPNNSGVPIGARLGHALLHGVGHYTALRATFGGKARHVRRHRMFAYMLGLTPAQHQASVLTEQSQAFRNLFSKPTSEDE